MTRVDLLPRFFFLSLKNDLFAAGFYALRTLVYDGCVYVDCICVYVYVCCTATGVR